MDITKSLQQWLNTPSAERDLAQGAMFLLQITRNRPQYEYIMRKLDRHADYLQTKLQNWLNRQLEGITHEQVAELQQQADQILQARHIVKPAATETPAAPSTDLTKVRKGLRADHDSLPPEIQALFTDNMQLLQRMRDIHTRLCIISDSNSGEYCQDSDRLPFLRELIKTDKLYRDNWKKYDEYVS